jgi:hypothetical protein
MFNPPEIHGRFFILSSLLSRVVLTMATVVLASTSFALAETPATPVPKTTVAQAEPAATPTPNPFTYRGTIRAYDFTRQNASNYPGVQFNSSPGAKYNSNAVNQASFDASVDLHADYHFAGGGWYVGGGYFYGNPFDGECVQASLHAKGGKCVTQVPPNTNPDDTLPGFTMSTFDEAYLGFKANGFSGLVGNMLLNNPWAGSYDATRVKATAYQGADFTYTMTNGLNFEAADMIEYENRTSSSFTQSTLLTSYPAGNPGLASNIFVKNCFSTTCTGINTTGFFMGKVGYTSPATEQNSLTANGYLYSVSDIVNMWYGNAQYTWSKMAFQPFIGLQGGFENNTGSSVIGKINSQLIGVQVGATYKTKWGSILGTFGFDNIPWKTDTLTLPSGVSCSSTTNTISAKGATLPYFLPSNTPDCLTSGAQTQVYYGGWASPYTDGYATDPLYTTQISQGMADRRAPGNSYKVAGTFTSTNNRFVFVASDGWYQYGNNITQSLAIYSPYTSLSTNEWNLDGRYYFSQNKPGKLYKGLMIRYRYAQREIPDTYFASGATWLGGIPLFKYNRAQIEYDF